MLVSGEMPWPAGRSRPVAESGSGITLLFFTSFHGDVNFPSRRFPLTNALTNCDTRWFRCSFCGTGAAEGVGTGVYPQIARIFTDCRRRDMSDSFSCRCLYAMSACGKHSQAASPDRMAVL
jgi:hypothetical protein